MRLTGGIVGMLMILCASVLHTDAQTKSDRVVPTKYAQMYKILVGNKEMIINPEKGGRIVSLLLNGKDFLTDSSINDFNWGSTFWLSPQKDWRWPPSATIDNLPYSATVKDNILVLTSGKDPSTGLVVTKAISGDRTKQVFVIEYTITNRSDKSQNVAPWEVTRVKPNGVSFFPEGKGVVRGGLAPLLSLAYGVHWYNYDKLKLPAKGDRQIYADGSEGWLAQVNNQVLLLKTFPDISPDATAPDEGEIELYASEISENEGYVEIEHQGAYATLEPGASMVWECHWIIRNLPPDIQAVKGNNALIAFVRNLIKE